MATQSIGSHRLTSPCIAHAQHRSCITSYHIESPRSASHHIVSLWHCIASHRIASYPIRTVWQRSALDRIGSHRIASHRPRTASHRIASHRIAYHCPCILQQSSMPQQEKQKCRNIFFLGRDRGVIGRFFAAIGGAKFLLIFARSFLTQEELDPL